MTKTILLDNLELLCTYTMTKEYPAFYEGMVAVSPPEPAGVENLEVYHMGVKITNYLAEDVLERIEGMLYED